jgi:outer membrane protein assembly factor BamE (lipoprotein component of BamABCDE complex)
MRWSALLLALLALGAAPARAGDCAAERSSRFSDSAFARVQPGMTRAQVDALLGLPLRENAIGSPEIWRYGAGKAEVTFSDGRVIYASGTNRIAKKMTRAAVEQALGKPAAVEPARLTTTLHFTEAGRCKSYAARIVTIGPDGHVTGVSRNDRAAAPKSALEIR